MNPGPPLRTQICTETKKCPYGVPSLFPTERNYGHHFQRVTQKSHPTKFSKKGEKIRLCLKKGRKRDSAKKTPLAHKFKSAKSNLNLNEMSDFLQFKIFFIDKVKLSFDKLRQGYKGKVSLILFQSLCKPML